MSGQLVKVFADKGYGFIRGEDGRDYFVHQTGLEVPAQFGDLKVGLRVSFTGIDAPKGRRAEDVRLL